MSTTPATQDQFHPDEWQLRVDLAACYRLVALYGWSDLVFTHISAKLPASVAGDEHQFLINPCLLYTSPSPRDES
jgi:ribulose-5-phosphate 4-epimerase/fuculose-1-phosphate aldolase